MFRIPTGAAARDAVSALVVLAICAVGIYATLDYPARAAEWPMWMWGILAVMSVILLFNSLRRPAVEASAAQAAADDGAKRRLRVRVAINIALVFAYVALVSILGFYVTTGVYLCVHMFYLGIRPMWKILVVAAGTLVALYAMFEYFLGVLIPHGLLF